MDNFMKELDKLTWDMLENGVTFIRDGAGVTYEAKFTTYPYNWSYVEILAQNLNTSDEQVNFSRNDMKDVQGFICYFLSAGGEISNEEMDNWYISE